MAASESVRLAAAGDAVCCFALLLNHLGLWVAHSLSSFDAFCCCAGAATCCCCAGRGCCCCWSGESCWPEGCLWLSAALMSAVAGLGACATAVRLTVLFGVADVTGVGALERADKDLQTALHAGCVSES
jgi:hypothetical protein